MTIVWTYVKEVTAGNGTIYNTLVGQGSDGWHADVYDEDRWSQVDRLKGLWDEYGPLATRQAAEDAALSLVETLCEDRGGVQSVMPF